MLGSKAQSLLCCLQNNQQNGEPMETTRWIRRSLVASIALLLTVGTAHATLLNLTQDGVPSSTVFGTVNIQQGADANHVDVTVNLNAPYGFAASSAGNSLEFNIVGTPAITLTNLTDGFVVVPGTSTAGKFGSFNYSVDCDGAQAGHCGPGSSVVIDGPLSFTVGTTGALSPDDFIGNAGGFLFAADISRGGIVAAGRQSTAGLNSVGINAVDPLAVPEPSTLLLLGLGLGLFGFGLRKRTLHS
jgi:hypothetical protein